MYCPLHYVLLFPHGELGWNPHIAKVGKEVDTQRQNGDDDNEEDDGDGQGDDEEDGDDDEEDGEEYEDGTTSAPCVFNFFYCPEYTSHFLLLFV